MVKDAVEDLLVLISNLGPLAALFVGAAIALSQCPQPLAEQVQIEGKMYERRADGALFPQIKNEWTDVKGTKHVTWITDYSKSAPIVVKNPPINVKSPPFNPKSAQLGTESNLNPKGSTIIA